MNKLAKQLIALGETNPDLRDHLRPILASLEKSADATRDFHKLLGDAEDAHEAGDKKKAKELLEKADAIAEKLKKPALMNRLHKARGRMSSTKVEATHPADRVTLQNFRQGKRVDLMHSYHTDRIVDTGTLIGERGYDADEGSHVFVVKFDSGSKATVYGNQLRYSSF